MDEWRELPLSQLKRLVKSRAGRIAELQMEIKILENIIEKKVREGDFGGAARQKPKKPSPAEEKREEKKDMQDTQNTEQSKIQAPSSSHAFTELE